LAAREGIVALALEPAMAKITKLEAAGRQLDSGITMFFANEDFWPRR